MIDIKQLLRLSKQVNAEEEHKGKTKKVKKRKTWFKLYVDMEWGTVDGVVFLVGVMYYNRKSKRWKYIWFKDVKSFFDWVESLSYERIKIYSHWGAKAEFKYFIKYYNAYYSTASNLFYQLFSHKGQVIKLIDTVRIIPAPLSKIGELIGLPKLESDFVEYGDNIDYDSEWFKNMLVYNKRDVEIMTRIKDIFHQVDDDIMIRDTIASTSFNYLFKVRSIKRFEAMFMPNVYRGGLVEVYKLHANNIKVYDVNSLYPSVMADWIPNPYVYPEKVKGKRDKDKAGIYHVKIHNYDLPYSFLSMKQEQVNKYVDTHKHEFNLTTSELDYLDRHSIEYDILFGYEVPKMYDLRDKIVQMYQERKKNPVNNIVLKLMLNSGYGKFGERDYNSNVLKVFDTNNDLIYNVSMGDNVKRSGGMWYFIQHNNSKTRHRNLVVASNITGSARVRLFSYYDKIPADSIIYTDTDSIHTTSNLLDEDCISKLGKLKVEYESEEGIYLGRKSYIFKTPKYKSDRIKEYEEYLKSMSKEYNIDIEKLNDIYVKMKGMPFQNKTVQYIQDKYAYLSEKEYEKMKQDLIDKQKTELHKSFTKITTPIEFIKTGLSEVKVEKNLNFIPNRYRRFESAYHSKPYYID